MHRAVIVILAYIMGSGQAVEKTDDGVIVHPTAFTTTSAKQVRIQVIEDDIIRVTASSTDTFSTRQSLMIVPQTNKVVAWHLEQEKDAVKIVTGALQVKVSTITGEVDFQDLSGHPILTEKKGGGKNFKAGKTDGENIFAVQQVFDSPDDEAFYGLGEHQNGIMNYKGHDVNLTQFNSVAVVPFFISNRKYGLLWDNYSITKFGDPRDYQQLSSMKLYDKDGKAGGLTVTYGSKTDAANVFLKRSENEISIEFLPDQKKMPKGYNMTGGKVTYEGFVEPQQAGLQKFYNAYAGYVKIWLDNKLVVDVWRQCWNPGTNLVSQVMEPGKKYPLRIEWLPDGGESYLALKCLGPLPGKDQGNLSLTSEAADQIDYYFIHGEDVDKIIHGYRQLTGKAPLVPQWALGLWQSRERYKSQEEVMTTVKTFRERHIPIDNIVQDWQYWKENKWGSQEFDPARFPDPTAMISDLHKNYHTNFMISVWPKFYEGIDNYHLFDKNGWLYKKNIVNRQKDWVGPGYVSTFYDAFNPQARKVFWEILNDNLFTKGVDAWWMDATEPDILSNSSIEERKQLMNPTAMGSSTRYFNAFAVVNAMGIYDGQRAANPDRRVFILTRSAYAGLQRYAAAVWSGDIGTRWHEMKTQISAGVNFSMSGIPYWSSDTGGFAAEHRFEHATGEDLEEWRELMTRWFQFGSFCPLFRVHGQYPYREIFNTAPENHPAYQSMLKYDRLRYRLMPYIYSVAAKTTMDDYTIMRGLVMDFAGDRKVEKIGDEYMFGPSLLVNPVYTYKATSRSVYLPAGQGWYEFSTGKYSEGGQTIEASAPLSEMPVFVKEGSIIPFGPAIEYTGEKPAEPITLYIYTGKDADFELYEDEGVNYNYEKGAYAKTPIHYDAQTRSLKFGERTGSFTGLIKERTYRIVWVSKSKPVSLNPDASPDAEVRYHGAEQIVSQK